MIQKLKDLIRNILVDLRIGLNKNLQYDIQTNKILRQQLDADSVCIDIGAHKGELLEMMMKCAPKGRFYAFEPIPNLYQGLLAKNYKNTDLFPFALSDKEGEATFKLVKNAPAYSGLRERDYDQENVEIEEIKVEVRCLDNLIDSDKIDLIKIDVEGAEYHVFKGAMKILQQHKPLLIFEFGSAASKHYEVNATDMFELLSPLGYEIQTLRMFLKGDMGMSKKQFETYYENGNEYYFVATAN